MITFRESLATSLLVKNKISLPNMVDDPLYSVVFLLEYNLSVPVSKQDKQVSSIKDCGNGFIYIFFCHTFL